MVETVKAVTGLNLEYSRFNMPEKDNPFVTATTANPDCACYPNESQYQFPLNWDTGPETLDVYYYPINHTGSPYAFFETNKINLNVASDFLQPTKPGYQFSQVMGGASCVDVVENPEVVITLTKTDNVFRDYPNIPEKCILADYANSSNTIGYYNPLGSFNVYHSTHSRISRKCWAGTGNLGTDKILVIYTYSQDSVSLVVCYLNDAVNGFMDSNDASKYPHAVFIPLGSSSPTDYLGGPIIYDYTFTGSLGGYGFNDSNFYFFYNAPSYSGNFVLNSYYQNFYYNLYNSFGSSYVQNGPTSSNIYLYYGYPVTVNDVVSNTPCVPNTTHWLCYSGRPQVKNFEMVASSSDRYTNFSPTYQESSAGSGVDAESYFVLSFERRGATPEYPGGQIIYPWSSTSVEIPPIPSCPGDTPINWGTPWVLKYTDPETGHVSYNLLEVLNAIRNNNPTGTIFSAGYLINTATPCSNSSVSYGRTWEPNPNFSQLGYEIVPYSGEPVNEVILGDGSTSYQTLELVNVGSATRAVSLFATDIAQTNAVLSLYGQYKASGLSFPQYVSDIYGTVDYTTEVITYKLTHHNVPILLATQPLNSSYFITQLVYEDGEDFLNRNPMFRLADSIPGSLNPPWLGNSYDYEIKPIQDYYKGTANWYYGLSGYNYGKTTMEVYPGGQSFEIPQCFATNQSFYNLENSKEPVTIGVVKKYKGAYVPYFLAGVRPGGGIKYPSNITEPKVRIYTTEENSPEDYYESTYPKRFFTEFDPSILFETIDKKISGTVTFAGNSSEVKLYYADIENGKTVNTGLPRMQPAFQNLVMQPEEGQCSFQMASINDFPYYLPFGYAVSLMSQTNNKMGIPEEYFQCKSDLVYQPPVQPGGYSYPGAVSASQSAFLFDTSRGAMQIRTASPDIIPPTNLTITSATVYKNKIYFPKLLEKAFSLYQESLYEVNSKFNKVYIPGWTIVSGNPIFTYSLSTVQSQASMNGVPYTITTCGVALYSGVINGNSDICQNVTLVTCNNGVQDITGFNTFNTFKKLTPSYYVSTYKQLYEDQMQPKKDAFSYYKSLASGNTAVSYPVEVSYEVLSGVKALPQSLGGGYAWTTTKKTYNTYAIFPKLAYFANIYSQSWDNWPQYRATNYGLSTPFVPSQEVVTKTVPGYGKIIAYFSSSLSPWETYSVGLNGWSSFMISSLTGDCSQMGVNFKINERKSTIGKFIGGPASFYTNYFGFLGGYANSLVGGYSSLEIADVAWSAWVAGFVQEIERNDMCYNTEYYYGYNGMNGIIWIAYNDEKYFYVDKYAFNGGLPAITGYANLYGAPEPPIPGPYRYPCYEDFDVYGPGSGNAIAQNCYSVPSGDLTWHATQPLPPSALSGQDLEDAKKESGLQKHYGIGIRYYS